MMPDYFSQCESQSDSVLKKVRERVSNKFFFFGGLIEFFPVPSKDIVTEFNITC